MRVAPGAAADQEVLDVFAAIHNLDARAHPGMKQDLSQYMTQQILPRARGRCLIENLHRLIPSIRGSCGAHPPARRHQPSGHPGVHPAQRAALLVAMLGFFVVALDAQIVNVARPEIHASLGGGLSGCNGSSPAAP